MAFQLGIAMYAILADNRVECLQIYISVILMPFLYLSWQFGGSTVPALVRAALHRMTLGVDNISWQSFGVFHMVFNVPTSHDAFLF